MFFFVKRSFLSKLLFGKPLPEVIDEDLFSRLESLNLKMSVLSQVFEAIIQLQPDQLPTRERLINSQWQKISDPQGFIVFCCQEKSLEMFFKFDQQGRLRALGTSAQASESGPIVREVG